MRLTTSGSARNFVDAIVGRVTTKDLQPSLRGPYIRLVTQGAAKQPILLGTARCFLTTICRRTYRSLSGCESLIILGTMMWWFWRRAMVSCGLFIDHMNAITHCSLRSAAVATA